LKRLPAVKEAPLRAGAAADRRDHARELHGRGWSNKKIARELQVHPSTVGRWFASAHLPDDTEDADVEEAENS
jgi:uncharacterized protein YjcR